MAYVDTPYGQIFYESVDLTVPWETRRETIVFHHGIGAHRGIWSEWLPFLIDRYRIVCFDMRGYGRSCLPPDDFRWSLDVLVEDMLALADALQVERPHVVGESIGGTVALAYALTHPERVASVTVSNGADVGAPLQKVSEWRKQIDEEGIQAWSNQFMRDRFYPDALTQEKYAWYARQQAAWSRNSILSALGVLVDTNLRPYLSAVRCPALLLHADSSPFIPVSVMVDMHQRIANSRIQVFARARHGLPFSHAKQCAQVLREFLDGLPAR